MTGRDARVFRRRCRWKPSSGLHASKVGDEEDLKVLRRRRKWQPSAGLHASKDGTSAPAYGGQNTRRDASKVELRRRCTWRPSSGSHASLRLNYAAGIGRLKGEKTIRYSRDGDYGGQTAGATQVGSYLAAAAADGSQAAACTQARVIHELLPVGGTPSSVL